jgi:hypothetical protein
MAFRNYYRLMKRLTIALLLSALARIAAGAEMSPGSPALKIEKALNQLDPGELYLSFEFNNPTDSVLYLDCQGTPVSARKGSTLGLSFKGAPDSSGPEAPARVGPRQVFRAERRLHGAVPGKANPAIPLDPARFAQLAVEMAFYPERAEGEGVPWVSAGAVTVKAPKIAIKKTGKRPPPPPVTRKREYVPPPHEEKDPSE